MPEITQNETLTMSFMPNTIEHLGAKMYSTLPPVISELVANSYDADAENVFISLDDSNAANKVIEVADDGHGMTFDDINTKYLRIGRNRRNAEESQYSPGGRLVTGKKGLGKLSFFGIANEIVIITISDRKKNSFILRWDDILDASGDGELSNYHPEIIGVDEPTDDASGTRIILRNIKRASDFDAEALANNLSKYFIIVPDFNVTITHGERTVGLDNERKYLNLDLEFEWKIPTGIKDYNGYENRENVIGEIFTTKKPIPAASKARGITLYSRKKLVNQPEHFSESDSSHFYSYVTGWLEIDFIDDFDEDLIETNRQSIDWLHPEMSELRKYITWIVGRVKADWRIKRSEKQTQVLTENTGINIDEWQKSIPPDVKDVLNPVLEVLKGDSEKPEDDLSAITGIRNLYELVPPHTYFHWRKLHDELKDVVYEYYVEQNYYAAVFEGTKRYIRSVKTKTGSQLDEKDLLENVFQLKNPVLSVTEGFFRPDGTCFTRDTCKNITEGHRFLALAIWQAFRDPIAHEEVSDLRDSGLYTEKDCLDALSLLSHLFRRLDNSKTLEQT